MEWIERLESGSVYDKCYRNAVIGEMELGLLKELSWICRECAKYIQGEKKNTDPGCLRPHIPPAALVNGLFQGAVPAELQGLTKVELSMISIYSNCTRIALNCGHHYHAKPTVYTIINEDLIDICELLPRIPDRHQFAILRHRKAEYIEDFKYRPAKVKAALEWLHTNNPLYGKIRINDNAFNGNTSEENFEQDCFAIDDDEMSCIDPFGACDKMGNAIPSTNSGSRGVDEDEILLHMPSKPVPIVETIVEAAVDEDNWDDGRFGTKIKRDPADPLIFERGQNHNFKFTKSYDEAKQRDHEDYFWEKCYPNLFPYGRGGPSDIRYCRAIKLSNFIQHMLQRGGNVKGLKQGRRF